MSMTNNPPPMAVPGDAAEPSDDVDSETSSQAAGVARGASRALAKGVKGSAAGRLPVAAKAASAPMTVAGTHLPKPPMPRGGAARLPRSLPRSASAPRHAVKVPRATRIPRSRADAIARASDRASLGMDVLSAGLESGDAPGAESRTSRTLRQLASFGRAFAVNTFLGIAVYATYEGSVDRLAASYSDASGGEVEDACERATLPQHFAAGAAGGGAHAVLTLAVDSMPRSTGSLGLSLPSVGYALSSCAHHSFAHALLFGSYQGTKRLLMSTREDPGGQSSHHLGVVALAGGFAGQCQHVCSHFAEQWLGLAEMSRGLDWRHRMRVAAWPTLRSTMVSFPPSAVGFVAFEYGKILVNDDS